MLSAQTAPCVGAGTLPPQKHGSISCLKFLWSAYYEMTAFWQIALSVFNLSVLRTVGAPLRTGSSTKKWKEKKWWIFFLKIHVFHTALSQPFSLCKQSLRALGLPSLRHYYNYRTYITEHGVATKCNWMSQDTRVQNHRFLLTDVEFKCVSWNCLIWHFGKRVSSEIFYFKRDQEA